MENTRLGSLISQCIPTKIICLCILFTLSYLGNSVSTAGDLIIQAQENESVSNASFSAMSIGADFSVRPSVRNLTSGNREEKVDFNFSCIDRNTGQNVPNCSITFSLAENEESGGHNHTGGRPLGEMSPSSGNSGPTAILETTYKAPEVSGIVTLDATGSAPGFGFFQSTFTIHVRVPGLQGMPPGANYALVGSFGEPGVTSRHTSNHYGLPAMNSMLITLANRYAGAFPGEKIRINDMSLVDGGLFDINNNWLPDHKSHRFGTDADIPFVPKLSRQEFRRMILEVGIGKIITERTHLHLRM